MIETACAQLRFTASLVFGIPFAPWSLDWLIDALQASWHEFGKSELPGAELLAAPALDDDTRRALQLSRFRAQATRAAHHTDYYAQLFADRGLNPARLRFEDIPTIPITPKAALRDDPDAFVRRTTQPCFRTTTTGTTGKPTCVCFSQRELHTYIALGAISLLVGNQITAEDIVLLSTSARATLGNTCFAGSCARIGAQVMLGGLIEPTETLALLAERRHMAGKKSHVSVLSTYPSYLGELVTHGLRLGYRPSDFGLERISVGGEIVTGGLKARTQQLFGPVQFDEGYGMTEPWPLGGMRCSDGHLHFDPLHGLVEVQHPDSDEPAQPGEVGRLITTTFPPFRETTILLRYDTEDMVRTLAEPLTCSLRHLPATSAILGKRRLAARHDTGWTFPREVLEALEVVEELPLPARCGLHAVPGGVAVEVVAPDTPHLRRAILQHLEAQGIPVRGLDLVSEPAQLHHPLPLRCDLRERSFGHPASLQAPLAAEDCQLSSMVC
jgi:phenylacetate-CoA ligase